MTHQTDRNSTDLQLAQEAEQHRNRVSKGQEGAHKPEDKTPYREAQDADRQATHLPPKPEHPKKNSGS
jgi:hypothetical protein